MDNFVAQKKENIPRADYLRKKPVRRSQLSFNEECGTPLPDMATLQETANNLAQLIQASCENKAYKRVSGNKLVKKIAVQPAVYLATNCSS